MVAGIEFGLDGEPIPDAASHVGMAIDKIVDDAFAQVAARSAPATSNALVRRSIWGDEVVKAAPPAIDERAYEQSTGAKVEPVDAPTFPEYSGPADEAACMAELVREHGARAPQVVADARRLYSWLDRISPQIGDVFLRGELRNSPTLHSISAWLWNEKYYHYENQP